MGQFWSRSARRRDYRKRKRDDKRVARLNGPVKTIKAPPEVGAPDIGLSANRSTGPNRKVRVSTYG
jgi:hypothetical protein